MSKKKKPKQNLDEFGRIKFCPKCGKPVFMFGLCYEHSAEFEKETADELPTHNDWRLT